jgi:hypothetical protein
MQHPTHGHLTALMIKQDTSLPALKISKAKTGETADDALRADFGKNKGYNDYHMQISEKVPLKINIKRKKATYHHPGLLVIRPDIARTHGNLRACIQQGGAIGIVNIKAPGFHIGIHV